MKDRMFSNRRAVLALLALLAGTGVFFLLRPAEPQPVYQGVPLRDWLIEFEYNQDTTNYLAAQQAIRAMGTNALPFLIRHLRAKDPPFNTLWVRLKARFGRLRKGGEYAVFWQRRAAKACSELGAAGVPAFPAMEEAMNNYPAAHDVGVALSRMLPQSAPILTNVLATGHPISKCRAAEALVTAFSHRESESMARTALLTALKTDADPAVRMSAASAFQFWNQNLDEVVPALTRVLSDPHPGVRGNAAGALGTIGKAAKSAAPELLKLLSDADAYPRQRAQDALSKIDPDAAAKVRER